MSAQRAPALDAASSSITAADFARHLSILDHDSLRGRALGSPGLEAAARYIAAQFRREGLQPLGGANFIQRYSLKLSRLEVAGTRLLLGSRSGSRTLSYGTDYIVMPGNHESMTGDIVLAGEAPVIAEHLPPSLAGRVATFYVPGGLSPEWVRRLGNAIRESTEVFAAGVLFVMDSVYADTIFRHYRPVAERESVVFDSLPQIGLDYTIAAELLRSAGVNPLLLKYRPAGSPPLGTGFQLELSQPFQVRQLQPPNVAAVLRGSDPVLRDEYVVVSAHFDQLGAQGKAQRGSASRGVDDDASGAVALLEIAHAFRQNAVRPARSVIFLALSGEEQGLSGSAAWLAQPPVPVGSIVADLNLDMLTRNSPDTLTVLGLELSALGPLVQQAAASHPDLHLTVRGWDPGRQLNLSAGDQISFLRAGVPSLLFVGAPHGVQQRDEPGRPDVGKAARSAQLAFLTAQAVASAAARPAWTEQGRHTPFGQR